MAISLKIFLHLESMMYFFIGFSHNTYHGPIHHYRPPLNNLVMQKPIEPSLSSNDDESRPLHSQLAALKLVPSGLQGSSRTVSRSSSRAGSPRRKNSFNSELCEVGTCVGF